MSKGKGKNDNKGGGGRVGQLIADAGKNLSGKEVQQIAQQTRYTPESIIARAERADVNVKPSAQNFVQQAVQAQTAAQVERATQAAPINTTPVFSYTPQGAVSSVRYDPFASEAPTTAPGSSPTSTIDPLAGTADFANVNAANSLALERLRQDAMTERTKYEVDNRIPLVEAETKGKLDLQKIVNAGYQNIARIERGSDMFRSIMGAFNF